MVQPPMHVLHGMCHRWAPVVMISHLMWLTIARPWCSPDQPSVPVVLSVLVSDLNNCTRRHVAAVVSDTPSGWEWPRVRFPSRHTIFHSFDPERRITRKKVILSKKIKKKTKQKKRQKVSLFPCNMEKNTTFWTKMTFKKFSFDIKNGFHVK